MILNLFLLLSIIDIIHRVYLVALMNFHTFHDMAAIDVNIRASDNFNVENFIHVAVDLLTGKRYQHHYS